MEVLAAIGGGPHQQHVPQLQGDVLIRTTECVNWGAGAGLRNLSNDTRGSSCRRHHVGEGLERTVSFAVWRRGLAVVDVLATGAVLVVARESGLGRSSSGSG